MPKNAHTCTHSVDLYRTAQRERRSKKFHGNEHMFSAEGLTSASHEKMFILLADTMKLSFMKTEAISIGTHVDPSPLFTAMILINLSGRAYLSLHVFGVRMFAVCACVVFISQRWRNWINVQWISRSLCRRCICCCFIVWVWVWMSVTEPKKRRKLEWTSQQPLLLLNTWPKWIQLFHFFAHLLAGFFFCMWLIASIYVYTLLIWCCCYVCCCFVCMRECVPNLRSKH